MSRIDATFARLRAANRKAFVAYIMANDPDRATSAQVLAAALFARFASRDADQLGNRFLSALRNKFGGHPSLSTKG